MCATSPVPESSWVTGQSLGIEGGAELARAPYLESLVRGRFGDDVIDTALAGRIPDSTCPEEPEPSMDHYLVISSDCHAGPETPDYKPYIDPEYHDAFDKSLVEREALLAQMREQRGSLLMGGDDEFQEEWFGHEEGEESLHEGGLRCGWDAPKRDKELDNDGVAAEVIFPGPDAATGSMGAPFGAGLVIGAELDPELVLAGARAYNRWCAELCSHSPERRKGLAVAPILGDIPGAVEEIRRAHDSGLHGGVLIPAQWGPYPSYAHDIYDPVWAVCEELHMPVHTHSGPGAHQDYGTGEGFYGMYVAETPVVDGAAALVPAVRGRVRAFPGAEVRGDRSRELLGRRPALDARRHLQPQPRRAEDRATGSRTSRCNRATTSTATSRSARRTRAVARSGVATRSASTTSCGATTSPTPKARGRTRASS